MSTYIMSDIHGCYSKFLSMLDKIGFSDTDRLIIAGDFIDRGSQNYEMLKWIEHCPANVWFIRGNHEEEFAAYVELLQCLDRHERLETNPVSNEDTAALYRSMKYFIKYIKHSASYFDRYGTISNLLLKHNSTLEDLCRWAEMIRSMPYYRELVIGNKTCIAVHAGYAERIEDIGIGYSSLEEFYLYAREESCRLGGRQHGMIVAGHTPTIAKKEFAYNKGKVFRYYDEAKDCTFYDIDCGCVFFGWDSDAKLACIRLEDENIFYI